jgi:hypothetical protein
VSDYKCRWCGDERKPEVIREDVVDRIVTSVDHNNGPLYCAECPRCMARGPLMTWAADALSTWSTYDESVFASLAHDPTDPQEHP